MDPVTALRQIAYYKDRNRHDPRRVMAYRNAADIIEGLDDAARQRHGQANSWQSLAGIGPKTAKVIAQAWSGREPDLLAELRADAEDLGGGAIRAALRGDLHLHSNWSDGSAPIEEMMATAAALGHQYSLTCEFLFLCSGYYNYDEGYSPRFAGSEDFVGPIIHPQHWPEDLDYDAKNIVVIGSGATAVTLVPALADSGAKHVTMLQRSPTYIVSQPDRDGIAEKLNRWLPETMAYTAVRWKNVLRQAAVYSACQKWPRRMRKMFLSLIQRQLPEGYDVRKHFGPHYNPWDQRLCLVPNGDLFRAIRHGKVEVVTDTIERFTATGIRLNSGRELPADIIITATGLNLQLFGGATATIDGQQVDITTTMAYKGMMLSGIPNMAYTVGYTNASWTLKADLVSEFVCRLLNYMDDNGFDTVVVERPGSDVEERPFMEFTPGYVLRSLDELPKQGSRTPWRLNQNYLRDIRLIRRGKIDDEGLRFAKRPAPVGV